MKDQHYYHKLTRRMVTMSRWQLIREIIALENEVRCLKKWLLKSYGVGNIKDKKT